jgi:hypothetical protein
MFEYVRAFAEERIRARMCGGEFRLTAARE